MRVGLIDVDGHNFPNIPLMKLSAWHKAQGNKVEWYDHMFSPDMDVVYMSKVFGFTPDYQYPVRSQKIYRGGVWLLHRTGRWQGDLPSRKRYAITTRDRTYLS